MALRYNAALKVVLEKIEIPEAQHKIFLDDAETIAKAIYQNLEKNNSIFNDMFKQLKLTANYTKEKIFDIPVEQDFVLCYELPFNVQTVFESTDSEDCLQLQMKTNVNHPIVRHGFVNARLFSFLVQRDVENAIKKMKPIICESGNSYTLKYKLNDEILKTQVMKRKFDENISIHIITATEQIELGVAGVITFSFNPVIKLSVKDYAIPKEQMITKEVKYWLAVPIFNLCENNFKFIPHNWPTANIQNKINMRNGLRMVATVNFPGNISELNNIKVHYQMCFEKENCAFEQIFNDMLALYVVLRLTKCGNLHQTSEIAKILDKDKDTLDQFIYFKVMDSVEIDDLFHLFGLSQN